MSNTTVCPAATVPAVDAITAANECIAKHTHNIAELKASMTKKREKYSHKCDGIFARIDGNHVAIAEARAVIAAYATAAAAIVEAERDAKWLESVFAAPTNLVTSVAFGTTGGATVTDRRRFALLAADSRRVDKRHWVKIYNFDDTIDLTLFAGAKRVSLNNLPGVVDVSSLAGVDRVSLFNMHNVSDISSLRGVRTLCLENLPLVGDASIVMLRGVHELFLKGLPLVTDTGIFMLRGVHTLLMVGLTNVGNAGIAALRSVEVLIVFDMPLVTDIAALKCVPNLNVADCSKGSIIVRGNPVSPF